MAWLSVGNSNEELCEKMTLHGVLSPGPVLNAFLRTDRGDFVTPEDRSIIYLDRPFKRGSIHISAPHMYATVLNALELDQGLSFLNIGSGSGYLCCLASCLLGRHAVNHGVEISAIAASHSEACVDAWMKKTYPLDVKNGSVDHGIAIVHGNCFDLDPTTCQHYDRIYVGAGCPEERKEFFFHLLADNGILVVPINETNEMVTVRKLYGQVFTSRLISHVHFAPLLGTEAGQDVLEVVEESPSNISSLEEIFEQERDHLVVVRSVRRRTGVNSYASSPNDSLTASTTSSASSSNSSSRRNNRAITLPAVVWAPVYSRHKQFPKAFQEVVLMLLCAANRYPEVKSHRDSHELLRGRPLCSLLPTPVWFHILSYTTRDWFVVKDEVLALRAELLAERFLRQRAEERLRVAESARRIAERERDIFRMVMLRNRREQVYAHPWMSSDMEEGVEEDESSSEAEVEEDEDEEDQEEMSEEEEESAAADDAIVNADDASTGSGSSSDGQMESSIDQDDINDVSWGSPVNPSLLTMVLGQPVGMTAPLPVAPSTETPSGAAMTYSQFPPPPLSQPFLSSPLTPSQSFSSSLLSCTTAESQSTNHPIPSSNSESAHMPATDGMRQMELMHEGSRKASHSGLFTDSESEGEDSDEDSGNGTTVDGNRLADLV
eukprot:gene7794-8605_t